MKIILSRKGFDSANGGCASPILSNTGEMFSLPIPEKFRPETSIRYSDIRAGNYTLDQFVRDLAPKKTIEMEFAHLDPDLSAASRIRPNGWKPLFGQARAAESHLQKHGVASGDLFLFFGWFRQAEQRQGRFRFVKGAPDLHVVFGWLQVELRIPSTDAERLIPWANDHPHYMRDRFTKHGANDSIYVSRDELILDEERVGLPGAGAFPRYTDLLCLTRPCVNECVNEMENLRSWWRLPVWFQPAGKESRLSYHEDPNRWRSDGEDTFLRTVGMGQEFVLDCDHYPQAIGWAADLLKIAHLSELTQKR